MITRILMVLSIYFILFTSASLSNLLSKFNKKDETLEILFFIQLLNYICLIVNLITTWALFYVIVKKIKLGSKKIQKSFYLEIGFIVISSILYIIINIIIDKSYLEGYAYVFIGTLTLYGISFGLLIHNLLQALSLIKLKPVKKDSSKDQAIN